MFMLFDTFRKTHIYNLLTKVKDATTKKCSIFLAVTTSHQYIKDVRSLSIIGSSSRWLTEHNVVFKHHSAMTPPIL